MSENDASQYYIATKQKRSMGVFREADEDFHPEFRASNPSIELNETQFFGFSVPEEKVHALIYTWAHPNLELVSSGAFVVQGLKKRAPAYEICDYRTFLPMSQFPEGLIKYETPGGLSVEVIEPGKLIRTCYLDEERNNSFDVYHRAMFEPCVWSNGTHFEQVMRTEGEVVLRGKRYDVDGTHVRDRSWGEIRSEVPRNIPPITWITAVFPSGTSFHLTAIDDPGRDPVWKDHFEIDPKDALKFGWIIVDGETIPVEHVSKLTHYDEDMFPSKVELEIFDVKGNEYRANGEVVAGFPMYPWTNCRWPICMTRWQMGGEEGWGETQDGQWTDFLLTTS